MTADTETDTEYRADELQPGWICEFEEFYFTVERIEEGLTENWVHIYPVVGTDWSVERYEKVRVIAQ